MANIREYIRNNLLSPLKRFPTVMQDTLLEIITDRLEEVYNSTRLFPESLTPHKERMDIVKTIADQYVFSIREEADIEEQLDILENIIHLYKKRGSIDTIENMWKYYGGDLPKEVEVSMPSTSIFRYGVSPLSKDHRLHKGNYQSIVLDTVAPVDINLGEYVYVPKYNRSIKIIDKVMKGSRIVALSNIEGLLVGDRVIVAGEYESSIKSISKGYSGSDTVINSPGVYNIHVKDSNYSTDRLKEFLLKELVAAGSKIHFNHSLISLIGELPGYENTNPYKYDVDLYKYVYFNLEVDYREIPNIWNMYYLSGERMLYLSILVYLSLNNVDKDEEGNIIKFYPLEMGNYNPSDIIYTFIPKLAEISYEDSYKIYLDSIIMDLYTGMSIEEEDPEDIIVAYTRYDENGEVVSSPYPGYFVLSNTKLGDNII